jgi:hypothetical protein
VDIGFPLAGSLYAKEPEDFSGGVAIDAAYFLVLITNRYYRISRIIQTSQLKKAENWLRRHQLA